MAKGLSLTWHDHEAGADMCVCENTESYMNMYKNHNLSTKTQKETWESMRNPNPCLLPRKYRLLYPRRVPASYQLATEAVAAAAGVALGVAAAAAAVTTTVLPNRPAIRW